MNRKLPYALVRYAAEPRTASLAAPGAPGQGGPPLSDFVTLAAHVYRGTYFPGTIRPADRATRVRAALDGARLRFRLEMEEPDIATVLRKLRDGRDGFWDTDFVCLNFLSAGGKVVQVAVKPDGSTLVLADWRARSRWARCAAVRTAAASWTAKVNVPLKALGVTRDDLSSRPVPFDVVRYQRSTCALTAWCPIPDQLPFNENYRFPVFCFGLLGIGDIAWSRYAPKSPDVGQLRYEGPAAIRAGEQVSMRLVYRAGRHGVATGGGIRFNLSNEVIECNRRSALPRPLPEKDWTALQWDDPRLPGYVAVRCARKGSRFVLRRDDVFSVTAHLQRGPALREGDEVTVEIGCEGPGVRAQLLTQRDYPVKWFADPAGSGLFLSPRRFPTIRVVGREAQELRLFCPPTPDRGERFRLVVVALDHYGNVAERHRGPVRFSCAAAVRGLPREYRFRAADRGTAQFDVSIAAGGAFTIQAADVTDACIHGQSNLILTDGSFGPGKILFGDIHTHSQLSDGRLGLPDKAREVGLHRGCDFWVSTDHDHDLTPRRIELLNRTVEQASDPGRFVALAGYEWTGTMGHGMAPWVRKHYAHRNVVFRGPVREVLDALDPRSDTPRKLHQALRRRSENCVIIHHFHCGDPEIFNDVERAVEISGWCGEFVRDADVAPGWAAMGGIGELLDRGLRFSIFAGTDHGTEAYYAQLPAELTGLFCESLTRDAVFDALRDGRGYATSGQRTLLKLTVNGVAAGHASRMIRAKRRTVEVVVGSATPVLSVMLERTGRRRVDLGAFEFGVRRFRWVDDDPAPPAGFYRVIVRTAQGHTAWSSPVFYELRPQAPRRARPKPAAERRASPGKKKGKTR